MTQTLLTVSAEATLGEAASAMAERGVGAVVVLAGDAIAAILTERDVMKAVAAGKDGSAVVTEWMTRHPDTIASPSSTTTAPTPRSAMADAASPNVASAETVRRVCVM